MARRRNNRRNDYYEDDRYDDEPAKRSGASSKVISRGKYQGQQCVIGWNVRRRAGMRSFFCGPYKGTRKGKSKTSNREWVTWMARVTNEDTGEENVYPCLYYPDSGKVIISQLKMVLNPREDYCGTYVRRKNNRRRNRRRS